ncbi:hypothetical protein [Bartonella tribocorum]|uniref:Uncharacterized protein n=1 Tax=Bartonella tribocorum (strain DSM 28219 / CCUG 45778 / CIP 105476 / IBS 506) TaxID=382640 RepID=A9IY36_BART1|nr:hypothetical protein [Bartonella tribocorum]CAK02289.1 hypothetical protein predicted by Glimmer/Critica [Bartonella tribocorum CIP 105476]CDO49620.1 hypothetical DNA-binding protein [Bartonella tribocorum]
MTLKPFAISELSDPSQVRVVLYSGDHFVHAPLHGVFDLLKTALKSELDGSLKDLEKCLEALREEVEDLKECSLDEAL